MAYSFKKSNSGFTLIEMLIVVAIVMIVAAILLFKYKDFSSNISIRGLAQQMALSIRKGQTYATSVRPAGTFTTDQYPSYGLAFSLQEDSAADDQIQGTSNKRFVLFADLGPDSKTAGDLIYENKDASCGSPKQGNECIEAFTLNSGDQIKEICTSDQNQLGGQGCVGITSGRGAIIMFHRPVPDAQICFTSIGCTPENAASNIEIVIANQQNVERKITVWNTGQISVE